MIESAQDDPKLLRIPSDCGLVSDPKRPRLNDEQAALAVNCLIRDDGPRKLRISCTSGVKGKPGDEWVEVDSPWDTGYYRFAFYYRGGMITNLFRMTTPKGSEYDIALDGGNPFDHVSIPDRITLSRMVVAQEPDPISVVPCWIISVKGSRPCAASLFYTKEEAEAAAAEQRQHYAKYAKDSQSTEKAEEKAKSKAQSSVAFKPKKTSRAPKNK